MADYKKSLGDLLYLVGCKIISNDVQLNHTTNVVQGRLLKRLGNSIQNEEYSYKDFLEYADDILTDEAKSFHFDKMLTMLSSANWIDYVVIDNLPESFYSTSLN